MGTLHTKCLNNLIARATFFVLAAIRPRMHFSEKVPTQHTKMRLSIILVVLVAGIINFQPELVSGANILIYMGLSGPSHFISFFPVIQALGDRGHNLTLLTLFPPQATHPSLTV